MQGITLKELYEIREFGIDPWDTWKEAFIVNFANIYTDFDNFKDALNYVIAVVSNEKTHMPSVTPRKE